MPRPASPETYVTLCWNCLGEFDALGAVWCSHDPKNPTKLCPFCLHCFCPADDAYKRLKTMNDIEAIMADCQDLMAQHRLDPATTRASIQAMLEE